VDFRLETELDWGELDEFLQQCPGASFYQSSTFLKALREIYGYRIAFLSARRKGKLVALLPFAERRRYGLIVRESLPFSTYGGPAQPVETEDAAASRLRDAFLAMRGVNVARLAWVGSPDPELALEGPDRMLTQIVDLAEGWAKVFERISPAKRRQIRQSKERGVVVERSFDPEDLRAYYPVYLENTRAWGVAKPTPLDFLQRLQSDHERTEFRIARHEGRVVGGAVDFFQGRHANYWHGSSLPSLRRLQVSAALYEARLRSACERGAADLNLGFSPDNPSLFHYKEQFGARAVACPSRAWTAPWFARIQRWRGRSA